MPQEAIIHYKTTPRARERARLWQIAHPERHRQMCLKAKKKYLLTIKGEAKNYAYKSTDKYTDYQLRFTYGISLEDKKNLYVSQHGLCKLCGKALPENFKKAHIDHNHKTKKIRGLLCMSCNHFLGFLEKHKKLLPFAYAYLGWS